MTFIEKSRDDRLPISFEKFYQCILSSKAIVAMIVVKLQSHHPEG